jgi:hypothetical protein
MTTLSAYHIAKKAKLSHWNALAEEWLLAIERYSRITDGDVPYWYNERANIGVLAGAAWRCGRIALEEFQHDKAEVRPDDGESIESAGTRRGRCDLWIAGDAYEEFIEAKFRWLNMHSSRLVEFATDTLQSAMRDATATKSDENHKTLGVAFLPLFIRDLKLKGEPIEELLLSTVEKLKTVDADVFAYTFPERVRETIGEPLNNRLPGMVMLVKRT